MISYVASLSMCIAKHICGHCYCLMMIYVFRSLVLAFVDNFWVHLMCLSLHIQVGGELMDFIFVLRDPEAVQTFCSRMHFSLGAGVSAAAGPVGRVLEADLRAGDKGSGVCYTYSCSKGNSVVLSCNSQPFSGHVKPANGLGLSLWKN